MSLAQTAEKFRRLRLHGIAQVVENLSMNPAFQAMGAADALAEAADTQQHYNDERRLKRLLKAAKFKCQAWPEDIDYKANRGLDRQAIASLLNCEWIRKFQHLFLTGLTGVGKTWLGCAFGHQACRLGIPVMYKMTSRLLDEIEIARGDGSLPQLRTLINRAPLLILDDLGLRPLTAKARHDLLEVVDDRCGSGSILITSQLPADKWYDWVGDPTIADAILDRLVHGAHRIELNGESMRARRAKH
jgi:DNA replication protein DnaC